MKLHCLLLLLLCVTLAFGNEYAMYGEEDTYEDGEQETREQVQQQKQGTGQQKRARESVINYQRYSFAPPFDQFTSQGVRKVQAWGPGGSASVKENFIRLTPDRQSKQGWFFNNVALGIEEFSAQLRFRISGQGKNLFGDGMGLWVTRKPQDDFNGGPLLGSTDKFYGFGILFDTFRNHDPGHLHKDISLVQSDGKEIDLSTKRPGCAAKYRFHEGKDSFSVDSESRANIIFKGNKLSLFIDPNNKGEWRKCFEAQLDKSETQPNLPLGWTVNTHVHFAFSASTGALADNHDVLEFTVAAPDNIDEVVAEKDLARSQPSVLIDTRSEIHVNEVGESVNELAAELKKVQDELKLYKHTLEHRLETVQDDIKAAINKVQDQENLAEERIEALEAKSRDVLSRSIEERVGAVEKSVRSDIERRLGVLEERLNVKVDNIQVDSGGWKWPFLLFALVVAVGLFFNFRSIRDMRKFDKII